MVVSKPIIIQDEAKFDVTFKCDGVATDAIINLFDKTNKNIILHIVYRVYEAQLVVNTRIEGYWYKEHAVSCEWPVGDSITVRLELTNSTANITGPGVAIEKYDLVEGFTASDIKCLQTEGSLNVERVDINPFYSPIRRQLGGRPEAVAKLRILHFLHEASRTGAPLILLRIVEQMSRDPHVENIVFVDRGGPLIEAFRALASTVELDDARSLGVDDLKATELAIARLLGDAVPCAALFNSLCNARFLPCFAARNVPTVYLVHELANFFPPSDLIQVYENSERVIYPSLYVQQSAWRYGRVPLHLLSKESIHPQGLLDPRFGMSDRAIARRALRTELAIADDSGIVLGCGSLDQRKGIDLFVSAAIGTLNQWEGDQHLVFIWVGTGVQHAHSPFFHATVDICNAGYEQSIRFIGERENTELYFMGADVFFLSSREDPFPCVVHEAMACALPVVAFAGGGGAPEALEEGAGTVIPHGDTAAAVAEITALLKSKQRRKEIGSEGVKRVRERYKFDEYCRKIATHLEAATGIPVKIGDAARSGSFPRLVRTSDVDEAAAEPIVEAPRS